MEPAHFEPWRVSWGAVDALAWAYLNRNGQIPASVRRGLPHHGLPRLRLWDDPSGMACGVEPTTLTVFELFTETYQREPVVREAVWTRSADLGRVQQGVSRAGAAVVLEPTVRERYAAVPGERLADLLREACGFRLPVAWFDDEESVTSDVGSAGFEFFSRNQPPASLRLTWSWDTPDEWRPVIEWYGRVRQLLEGCLATGESRS